MPAPSTHAVTGPAALRILPTQQLLLCVDSVPAACELLQCPVPLATTADNAQGSVPVMGTVTAVGPVQHGTDCRQSLRARSLVSRCIQLDGACGAMPLWLYDENVRCFCLGCALCENEHCPLAARRQELLFFL